MQSRFVAEGKPGATMRSGSNYSTWWNGGLRTTVYFHNMIGLLTEAIELEERLLELKRDVRLWRGQPAEALAAVWQWVSAEERARLLEKGFFNQS